MFHYKIVRMFGAVALIVASIEAAQSQTHSELQSLVQQLQAHPSDDALRERIIETARDLKPAPAIPPEARDYFIRGTTIAKAATNASGQQLAVENFQKALRIAPWWADALYNLAVAQELAGQFDQAKSSFRLYVHSAISEQERQDALDRISMIEAKKELANEPGAREEQFLNSLNGAVFEHYLGSPGTYEGRPCPVRHSLTVEGRVLVRHLLSCSGSRSELQRYPFSSKVLQHPDESCPGTLTVAVDGNKITQRQTCLGKDWVLEFSRVR